MLVGHRVKIEQCFGILKRVFGSLRGLRIRVDKNTGHKRACEWIMACFILYNLIKPTVEDEGDASEITVDEELEVQNTQTENNSVRNNLFNWYLRHRLNTN